MRNLCVFCSVWFVFHANAQIGGDYTYQFLQLLPSPRHAALGGVTTTLSDTHIEAAMANPALVSAQSSGQFTLNIEPYFAGINRGTAAYAIGIDRQKALLFDVRYIHYGSFDARDELGTQTGTFSGSEVALGVSYAHYLLGPNLYAGLRLSLISSSLDQYHSWGLTSDLGLYYQPFNNKLRFALVAMNIGTQITTYDEVREQLPFSVNFGVSNELAYLPLRWHLGVQHLERWDLAFVNSNQAQLDLNGNPNNQSPSFLAELSRHLVLGAELFPERSFSVQLGYNFLRATELRILDQRNFSGLSVGFGLNIRRFRFQYSHTRYTVAGNSSFFGLTFKPFY